MSYRQLRLELSELRVTPIPGKRLLRSLRSATWLENLINFCREGARASLDLKRASYYSELVGIVAASRKIPAPRASAACLRAVVCLLLVGLFLYNPFLSLIHSSTGLSVHHLACNRATVGSSELQPFSPISGQAAVDVLLVERAGEGTTISGGQEFQLAPDLMRDRAISADHSSNLWFRPPPSA